MLLLRASSRAAMSRCVYLLSAMVRTTAVLACGTKRLLFLPTVQTDNRFSLSLSLSVCVCVCVSRVCVCPYVVVLI